MRGVGGVGGVAGGWIGWGGWAAAVRGALATAWAGVLFLLGVVVIFEGPGPLPLPREAFWFVGAASLAAGQFVFAVLVADRWFPRAHPWIVLRIEGLLLLTFVVSLVLAGSVVFVMV
jgi:hypothetical protein